MRGKETGYYADGLADGHAEAAKAISKEIASGLRAMMEHTPPEVTQRYLELLKRVEAGLNGPQVYTQQATIDRLTAQLALAVEAGAAYLTTVYQHNDFCNQRECDCGTEDREGADLAKLLTALRFTDPDIAAAVQAMQAGRRVLDREWLKEMLSANAAKVYQQYSIDAIADAIIAKLKEAQ